MKTSIRNHLSVILALMIAFSAIAAAFAAGGEDAEKTAETAAVTPTDAVTTGAVTPTDPATAADMATATDPAPAAGQATATEAEPVASATRQTEKGYTFIISNGQAVVIAADDTVTGAVTLPDTLGGAPVAVIGMGAFKDNASLTAVTLPDSVAVVDEYAFAGCAALEKLTLGKAIASFPENAAEGCENLSDIVFPTESKGYFVDEAGAVLNKEQTELVAVAKTASGEYTVPETVTKIRANAFRGCDKLTGVILPDGLRALGDGAFAGCTALTAAVIPQSCTVIGKGVFEGCEALANVSLPVGITEIPAATFAGCAKLATVENLDTVAAAGEKAFYNCAALKNVGEVIRYSYFGKDAFTGTAWYAGLEDGPFFAGETLLFWKGTCDAVADLSDKNITAIAPGAFSGCDTLSILTLPEGLKTIGAAAFENCSSLASVSFTGVAVIGPDAFAGTPFLASSNGGELYLGVNLLKAAATAGTPTDATPTDATPTDATPTDATPTDATPTDAETDGTVYTVSFMAKSIASGAFIDANPAIEEIILPSGLEIISEGAFEGLGSLKKVNIPESVRYGNDAFETLQSACRHKNTVLKYADAAVCENPYFTGCVYCADCAALLEGGAIAPAEGHRFHKVKEEADTTLGQNVAILECAVCGTQRRIPYSEYSVKFIDNGNKAAAEGDYIVITQGTAMADILKGCPEGTLVLNADGKRVFDLEKTVPGSGMTVLFPSSRSYTVLLYGDADGDGVIRPSDARFALRRSVKLEEALGWRDKACHVVYDGKEAVTSEDARMILRASVRLEEPDLLGRATGKPATETDAKPATDTDAKPATETDAKPATETDAKPATDTDAKPTEPDTKPAEEPAKETYKAGNYVCTASSGVYLRVYYGTKENGKLWDINDIIQKDEVVYVMEVIEDASTGEKVYWGKIDHKGAVGWSMLQYFEAK